MSILLGVEWGFQSKPFYSTGGNVMLTEIETFVNWLRRRNPHARTWRDYRGDLQQFAAVVGDRPPEAVTFYDVDRFVAEQVGRGLQPPTVNRRLAAITSFYSFLADEDPGLVCPVLPRRHGLKERQRLPRPVRQEDLDKFFAAIDDRCDRAMFLLILRLPRRQSCENTVEMLACSR
jgi:site-specific recombinase XerD